MKLEEQIQSIINRLTDDDGYAYPNTYQVNEAIKHLRKAEGAIKSIVDAAEELIRLEEAFMVGAKTRSDIAAESHMIEEAKRKLKKAITK